MRLMMNITKNKLNDQGFTLIEVLISITILALISIPLMKYFSDSLMYSSITEKRQRATLLAQQTIETLKAEDTLIVQMRDPLDSTKLIYAIPAMTTKDTFSMMALTDEDRATFESEGKGHITLKKCADSDDKKYEVFVDLDTNVSANDTKRATIYGIDEDEDIMVVEQTEEMDALWYFLQLNNSYVVSQQGFASVVHSDDETEEHEGEGGDTLPDGDSFLDHHGDGGDEGDDGPIHHSDDEIGVDMFESIDDVRELLQRDIYIVIGKESLDPYYYTISVHYVYSCKEKIAAGNPGEDIFITSDLVNDRVKTLNGIYLMYNIVDPDSDNIYFVWNTSLPTDADEIPKLLLVCQNLDSLIGASSSLPEVTPVAGELSPVYWQKDKAVITVICVDSNGDVDTMNSYAPKIRTNFKSSIEGVADKAEFMLGDASYDSDKIEAMTSWDKPVRILDMTVKIYEHKDDVTDYSAESPLVVMKTTKGE